MCAQWGTDEIGRCSKAEHVPDQSFTGLKGFPRVDVEAGFCVEAPKRDYHSSEEVPRELLLVLLYVVADEA